MKFVGKGLLVFFSLGMTTICLVASSRFVKVESTMTILIFSFLFGSIIFQLNGSISKKVGLLAIGDSLGLFWNVIFYHFASAGTSAFGRIFETLYVLVFPFLNMLWIICFWSLSMSYLSKQRMPA